jgi:hypothetical protein
MGGLRPIGSEKLEGMDKIRRIMEIARYNESIPQPVNEDKKTEYTAELADGKTYTIVRERLGYIIKESYDDINSDYIEPIQNRKYFPSYSQALKKLNLMAKDFNQMYGNEEGMSLFTEQKKKFKLKLPGKKKAEPTGDEGALPPPEPVAASAPAPAVPPMDDMGGAGMAPPPMDDMGGEGLPPPPMDDMGGEGLPPPPDMSATGGEGLPPPPMDDMGDDELPPMDDMGDDEESEDEGKSKKEGGTTFKVIQKLTGKLAQRIRKYNSEDDMDPNDVKYIINSILSALDVDLLDDDDLEEIISRLEGDFDEKDNEDEDEEMDDEEMNDEELPEPAFDEEDEGDLPPPPPAGGEMAEYRELGEIASLSDAISNSVAKQYAGEMFDKVKNMPAVNGEFKEEDEYGRYGAREPRHKYNHLSHGTFGESKVDKIISQYFTTQKKEIISEEKKKIQKIEKYEKLKETNYMNVKNLSEGIKQERMALKYMEKNPVSVLIGKTNKGSLVFKEGVINTKITINGLVI